jgi:ketosteroid isomerase-like protein
MVRIVKDVKPEDLKHHFVFIEKVKDGKAEYGGGEYLVLQASPNTLYVVKPNIGYDFHDAYSYNGRVVTGTDAWTIVEASYDRDRLLKLARDNYVWGTKGGKQWVGSVYEQTKSVAAELFRSLNEPLPILKEDDLPDYDSTIVAGRAEVLLSKRMRSLIAKTGCQQENVKAIVERIFFELGQ